MRVAIDAGHGWHTAGKRTPKFEDGSFMHEFEFNQAVAVYLNQIFQNTKIETFFTCDITGEEDYGYNKRVALANTGKADLYVSIHANAIGDGISWNNSYGILFLADERREGHIELGQTIIDKVIKIYPRNKLLAWIHGSTGQSLCKYSEMPTAIIENGFMTNREDAALLKSTKYRADVAQAIYLGIIQYGVANYMIDEKDFKEEQYHMNEQTRIEAERALMSLNRKGFVSNPQEWAQKLETSIPAWAFFIIIDRIVTDYGIKIDEFDKYMGGIT